MITQVIFMFHKILT